MRAARICRSSTPQAPPRSTVSISVMEAVVTMRNIVEPDGEGLDPGAPLHDGHGAPKGADTFQEE